MAKKSITTVGIEFDNLGIRAAKVTSVRKKKKIIYLLEGLEEVAGDFSKDDILAQGLKEMCGKIGLKAKDRVVASLSGKQVYVTHVKFKPLPVMEMKNALRFEIRKNLPFEAAGAALDYQILEGRTPEEKARPTVMVTAVASQLLERLIQVLGKADIRPWIVDVLPMVIANAFWVARDTPPPMAAHVMVHFSPDVCNLVIDGVSAPFFSRSVYFAAEEIYGKAAKPVPEQDRAKRLEGLAEELRRSLSYYEKTFGVSNFGWVYLVGNYVQNPDLRALIREKLGLPVDETPLLERIGSEVESVPGRFDLAVTLALRGKEES